MKTRRIILALLLAVSSSCLAHEKVAMSSVYFDAMIYRPIGLAATLLGLGLFLGLSPVFGIATLYPPHDAFSDGAEMLILTPAEFTFNRPLGALTPDENGVYRR